MAMSKQLVGPCGCGVRYVRGSYRIDYCKQHKVALSAVSALAFLLACVKDEGSISGCSEERMKAAMSEAGRVIRRSGVAR